MRICVASQFERKNLHRQQICDLYDTTGIFQEKKSRFTSNVVFSVLYQTREKKLAIMKRKYVYVLHEASSHDQVQLCKISRTQSAFALLCSILIYGSLLNSVWYQRAIRLLRIPKQ